MAQDVLTVAWKYIRRRKFATAIKMLENRSEIYEDNFEYYLMLGTACLYAGDIGTASSYYQRARKIKISDSRLLLGQAAIFLRRGDTDRALQYYMDIKDIAPNNKTMLNALEFIRKHGDYDTICRWVDTGRIEQFYPPLGVNPQVVTNIALPVLACIIGCILVISLVRRPDYSDGTRLDIKHLALSPEEKTSPQEQDLSTQPYSYILSSKQITDSYNQALKYFQSKRDNAAQVEINTILNSNASVSVKQKAHVLMTYLEEPTFDTLVDNPSYKDVESDTTKYLDCWVSWSGKVSNAVLNPDGSYSCQLLVGYDSGENVDGIVAVKFNAAPNIVPDQPVRILGKISLEDEKIYLRGKSVYQSVKNGMK